MSHREAEAGRGHRQLVSMLTGQISRIAVQGVYFVLLTRSLGASEFGATAALLALVALLSPFSSLGAALLLVRSVSIRPANARVQWANTVVLTLGSGATLSMLLALASPWLAATAIEPWMVALVALSDLVFARLVDGAAGLYQALHRMARAGYLQVFLQLTRLLALLILIASSWPVSPRTWAISYFAASAPMALVLVFLVTREVGATAPKIGVYLHEWRAGAMFAIGMSTQTIYNDIDKVFLARLSTLEATGIYAAAYRIVDISYAPIRSLIAVSYPSMFRAGHEGIGKTLDVVRASIVRPGTFYCAAGVAGLMIGAPLLPAVLGHSFADSVPALQALSILLLLKGIHFTAADTLTCSNRQGARTVVQVGIAFLNVLLCLWLIPVHGWRGAIMASLLSDGLLAVSLWLIVFWRVRQQRIARLSADLV